MGFEPRGRREAPEENSTDVLFSPKRGNERSEARERDSARKNPSSAAKTETAQPGGFCFGYKDVGFEPRGRREAPEENSTDVLFSPKRG
ncbi:MAG: hypothetical protein J6Z79_02570, partial [Clostridia bacterium]|nr:hypothetical protein [Clostridia bacterium]